MQRTSLLVSYRRSSLLIAPMLVVLASCSSSEPLPEGGSGTAGTAGTAGAGSGGTLSGGAGAGGSGMTTGGASGGGTSGLGGTSAGTTAQGGSGAGGGAGQGTGGSLAGSAGTGGNGGSSGGAGAGGAAGDAGTSNGGTSNGGTSNGGTSNGGTSAGSAGSGAGTAGTGNGEPKFHVFLLLGQSNMAGYAKAEAADKVEDPRVRVLGFDDCGETGRETDVWDTAAPPLHECWNGAVGPGDHFAKTLLPTLPPEDTIGLVPCAISGERIETFLKNGGTRYDWIVDRARLAQEEGGIIEGILFHQGESNNGDSSWPGKVNTLVTDLRADLEIGDVPFLAGELVGNGTGHNAQVARLPELVTNAHVISAAGLIVDPADTQWNLHFDHDSTVTLGIRYAEKMIDVLGL